MPLRVVEDGFDFRVLVVDEAWVFRFARRPEVAEVLATETLLLPAIASAVPVEVPRFEYVSREPAFVVYELVEGTPLRNEDPSGVRAFLDALHSLDVAALPLEATDWVETYRRRCEGFGELVLPLLDRETLAKAEGLFDDVDSLAGFRPALVHADLGPEHMLVRHGLLAGVIDWADAAIGDPALDYAWLLNGPFPEWEVDDDLRRRAHIYHRLGPFYAVHYGVFTQQPAYVERALATLRSRL